MRHFLQILLLFASVKANSQSLEEKDFTRYTKLDGLSNNYITALVQDGSGYIWVATNKGLNRFDGKSFTNFFKNSNHSPIPENLIWSLRLHGTHELIGTTVAGAFSYNSRSRETRFFLVPADPNIFFWANQGWDIVRDSSNNYVVSTKTGLYVFDSAGKIVSRYDHYSPADGGRKELWFGNWLMPLANGTIFQENGLAGSLYNPRSKALRPYFTRGNPYLQTLATSDSGDQRICFKGNGSDLFFVNTAKGTIEHYNLINSRKAVTHLPRTVLSDFNWFSKSFYLDDTLVAFTSKVGGFYLFRLNNGRLSGSGKKHFASRYCTSILKDEDGRLWIGTSDGLYKQNLRNGLFSVNDLSEQFPSVIHHGIQSVYIEKENQFVGLGNEGGLLLMRKNSNQKVKQIRFDRFGEGSSTIHFIFDYHPDTLWLGTGRGVIWLNRKNFSSGRIAALPPWIYQTKTRTFLRDSRGNIWLSFGNLNSVVVFDANRYSATDLSQDPLLKITFCFSMAEDKNGHVWLAGDGLSRWNRKLNKIDRFIPYPSVGKKLFNYMQLLGCDDQNNLWITSFDNQVLQYDLNTNQMHLRLPENSMVEGYSVTNSPIINGHIWLGMVNGISAFNTGNYSIKQFNYADGLPSVVVTSFRKGSFYDAASGRFYFGAGKYLVSFRPEALLSTQSQPRFVLEVPGEYQPAGGKLNLPHNQNSLDVRFNAINFSDPEENRFAYRFSNDYDTSWQELNTKNTVLFSKLPPGSRRLEVKLYSVNNRWPAQIRTLNIFIRPPFYQTVWFYVLAACVLIFAIWALYRYRVGQIQRKADLDRLLAQTEMKALHAQMNPHFIFNCLNSIREMILNQENRQASHYLGKFAQLIRFTLQNSTKPFISLANTIDYIERYLEMEKIRREDFSFLIEVDEALDRSEIFLPPMLIQPFLENALWHGQVPGRSMHILISFKKKGQELVCLVEDNGIGIEASIKNKEVYNHAPVGIANIRQRIQVLNDKYRLRSSVFVQDKSAINSADEPGTIVTIRMPVKNNEL